MSDLLKPSTFPSFPGRAIAKSFYYWLFGPLYRRVRAEVSEEMRANRLEILNQLSEERSDILNRTKTMLKTSKEDRLEKYRKELQSINTEHIELMDNVNIQIADEFVKIYRAIDDLKSGEVDVNLNGKIVDELIKIHKGIEEIKYSNGQ